MSVRAMRALASEPLNFNPYFNGFRMSVSILDSSSKDSIYFNPYFNGFRMSVRKIRA